VTTSGAFTLTDGRWLSYVDIGDHDGVPVISCHGGLSSGLDIVPAAGPAAELGIRVIAPDRPGIGGSDRQPGRTLLDWPSDVAQLADRLGLASFAVLGWSAGGMYAQVCAAVLAGRVTALGLVASVIPPDWPGMRDEINRMDRIFMELSHAGAPVDRAIFTLMRETARHRPAAFAERSGAPKEVSAALGAAIAEGLADTRSVDDEYQLLGRPWGFDPAAITVPTTIWQGTADTLVPASWAQRLAQTIPGAVLHLVDGASHFLWYDHWNEILGTLARTDDQDDGNAAAPPAPS
jgi:pimeloyl-ACP methyl ester carboxylesterase